MVPITPVMPNNLAVRSNHKRRRLWRGWGYQIHHFVPMARERCYLCGFCSCYCYLQCRRSDETFRTLPQTDDTGTSYPLTPARNRTTYCVVQWKIPVRVRIRSKAIQNHSFRPHSFIAWEYVRFHLHPVK